MTTECDVGSFLDWIPEQKKDVNRQTDETQITSVVRILVNSNIQG